MSTSQYTKNVLNAGSVSVLYALGDDLTVVNAAKVSFAAQQTELDDKGKGLINYLLTNKHATPFEHVLFQFHIKCPIFVAREWFRHRWSSFNEMSMRYHVPESLEFFIPNEDAIRKQVGKPGHYTFEKIEDPAVYDFVTEKFEEVYRVAESNYYEMIEAGIAKEIARCVIPVGQYTEFIWTVNLRSLLNFLSLRNEVNAQREIQQFAEAVEQIITPYVPVVMKTFIDNQRQAI
jgi:thymidylate synthase (FAD)